MALATLDIDIDDSILGEDELLEVKEAVATLAANACSLGLALGISPSVLEAARLEYGGADEVLTEVLQKWLKQHYNVARHGVPSWRSLARAVRNPAGGNDSVLAMYIAASHPVLKEDEAEPPHKKRRKSLTGSTVKSVESKPRLHMLSLNDLALVLSEVYDLQPKWYELGLQLSVPVEELEAISKRYHDPSTCLQYALMRWLKTGNATWSALCEALCSRIISHEKLADEIRYKYLPAHSGEETQVIETGDSSMKKEEESVTFVAPESSVSIKQRAQTVKELSSSEDDQKHTSKADLEPGKSHTDIDASSTETNHIISQLEYFNEKATACVKSEIDSMIAQHRDEVQELKDEMGILSKENKQLIQQLDLEPHSKLERGLRGVDVCGEASLTVTNKAQRFMWKKFGLKLTIPSGVLPPDVDKCDLLINTSLSGNYLFPRRYRLVSPIFWIHCKPNCKLAKAITLEVQHCALDHNVSKLSFVKASCTQKELPYSFEIIFGGKFSTNSSYGLVELKHFSGIGTAQEGTEEREYCARLFYLTNSIHDRQVHFTITWNLDAHRNVTEEHYAKLHGTPGPEQEIDFESDAVTLDIPERGGATEKSWKIVPLMRPRVTKKQVDSFKEGKMIPHCELQVLKLSSTLETGMYRVNLLGAKDDPFFVIRLSPEDLSESSSQNFGARVYAEKHLVYLMGRLKDHAHHWKTIGGDLGFSQGQLKNIESNPTLTTTAPVSYLKELLTQWLQLGKATLQDLKSALNNIGLGVTAEEIVIPN